MNFYFPKNHVTTDFRENKIIKYLIFFLQKVALGNQLGRVYVWDIDTDDPAQAK